VLLAEEQGTPAEGEGEQAADHAAPAQADSAGTPEPGAVAEAVQQ
jgi:hypothetical protein